MSKRDEPIRIEIRFDRPTARRVLIVGGTLLMIGVASVALAVPVTFADGNVLTAQQLNTNFADLEQRLQALEQAQPSSSDGGSPILSGLYTVTATAGIEPPTYFGGVTALCNPGDTVISGSCSQNMNPPLSYVTNGPFTAGVNGWQCDGYSWAMAATFVTATAMCVPGP